MRHLSRARKRVSSKAFLERAFVMNASRPLVLAVDDDAMALHLMNEVLAPRFEVLTIEHGERAVELLREREVAAILADHFLPAMTGVELLDRAQQLRPSAARLLITAADHAAVFSDAVNRARIHRLLVKPVRWPELAAMVDDALREVRLEVENARLLRELAQSNQRLEAEVGQRTAELKAAVAKLEELAVRDELTALFNHRFLQHTLDAELARAKRHGHALALLFIDVDHFRLYNEQHGQVAGDALLRRLAHALTGGGESGLPAQARASDVIARYGGEEFVMLLPYTGLEGALAKAERVRRVIAEQDFAHAATQPMGCVSVSIGASVFPEHGADKEALLASAAAELARAKRLGRNRVCAKGRP
jgi:diguanylate cyclase (GGDEF)-like protein